MKDKFHVHTAIEYDEFMCDREGTCASGEERNKVGRRLESLPENLARELLRVLDHWQTLNFKLWDM